jgi:hypothetical protein
MQKQELRANLDAYAAVLKNQDKEDVKLKENKRKIFVTLITQ